MQSAGTEALNNEQKIFQAQLSQAVERLNEANILVTKNHGNEKAALEAIALSLVAVGKVLVLSKAADANMMSRLPALK
jgi:hypothetical protein